MRDWYYCKSVLKKAHKTSYAGVYAPGVYMGWGYPSRASSGVICSPQHLVSDALYT